MNNIDGVHSRIMGVMRPFIALVVLLWFGVLVSRAAITNYVAHGGQTPSGKFTSWDAAASNIQDAINVVGDGGIVLVSNGVYGAEAGGLTNYPSGGSLTNRVVIASNITVQSANNNPTNTIIKGNWHSVTTNGATAVRCVYMGNASARLIGFTITNGASQTTSIPANADTAAGGVHALNGGVISNCIITGNSGYQWGGGAFYCKVFNCQFIGNAVGVLSDSAGMYGGTASNCTFLYNSTGKLRSGGAAAGCTLYNCTFISNTVGAGGYGGAVGGSSTKAYNCLFSRNSSAGYGGAAYGGSYNNCTFVSNYSEFLWGGGVYQGFLTNCISWDNNAVDQSITSAFSCGVSYGAANGNIESDPKFVNSAGGNYRLSAVSPCINTGTNFPWITDPLRKDLDGRMRVRYGTVDMGAYEHIHKGTICGIW